MGEWQQRDPPNPVHVKLYKAHQPFLLDVSNPLLNIALSHARTVLGPEMKDGVFFVFGTMHDLAQGPYADLYQPQPAGTKRLITMLGYTFGNLESELQFVRNNLSGFAKGDLLLLNLQLTFAPADEPEQIQKKNPRLNHAHSKGWDTAYEEFLANTIRRSCLGVKHIEFFQELDLRRLHSSGKLRNLYEGQGHHL